MKFGFRHIFFSLLMTFACVQGQAATIIYSGIGDSISGSLGGVVFSNAAYTITLPSDTANIIDFQALNPGFPFPIYNIDGVSGIGSIEIAGVGTATFTNALGLIAVDQRIFGGTTQIAFRLNNGAVGSLPFISGDFDAWDLTDPYYRTAPVDPTMHAPPTAGRASTPPSSLLDLHLSLRDTRKVHTGPYIDFDGQSYEIAPTARKVVTVIYHPRHKLWITDHSPKLTWPPILGHFTLSSV